MARQRRHATVARLTLNTRNAWWDNADRDVLIAPVHSRREPNCPLHGFHIPQFKTNGEGRIELSDERMGVTCRMQLLPQLRNKLRSGGDENISVPGRMTEVGVPPDIVVYEIHATAESHESTIRLARGEGSWAEYVTQEL